MKKHIFIDVDGTLCMPNGEVPESAIYAIRKAREIGHSVYLCTGRSIPELTSEITSIGFDGVISAGGGCIDVGSENIFHTTFTEEEVKSIIQVLESYGSGYYLESNEGLYGSENCASLIKETVTKGLVEDSEESEQAIAEFDWFFGLLETNNRMKVDYGKINKISFIGSSPNSYEQIEKNIAREYNMYRSTVPQFGRDSGEIALKGVDKFTAIKLIEKKADIAFEQTLAIGDGSNDIRMFNAVNYRVAMKNATEELKKAADEITESAVEDGIYRTFLRNNII
ncbi:Cof-type HAD-IIB family hydrolase [Salipaludibacillus sp. CUR1]|uniref:Cof-type HAD-IIB family hydrolase n=1 Tax=Salipaludibacillus sp. CUR1 TaxID=2820003 RepID=UPI001E3D6917|nr:Cof-type HAD-IIB family hydrolase [Salipaludibacillus sp. CUR1]MCE7792319.1 Cof-type HAD-IIB family hydrolase [Salipaludibacillus sp. CUR1]